MRHAFIITDDLISNEHIHQHIMNTLNAWLFVIHSTLNGLLITCEIVAVHKHRTKRGRAYFRCKETVFVQDHSGKTQTPV